MQVNIPIYRAKKIDSDKYAEGYLTSKIIYGYEEIVIKTLEDGFEFRIDSSTLSVHFPDMLDSDGNKIFASLSTDGKGGDIIIYKDWKEKTAIYQDSRPLLKDTYLYLLSYECKEMKVIGIQQ